ncbi:MAG: ribose-phosphate diphosphokinase [Candidatus Methanomethyliales bacterium]|nr:ribose-phosphate diphosphokinase [Candidatus Methanomethylicales archaeon]
MILVSGPSSITLGGKVAQILGVRNFNVEYKNFPDGESYLRLPEDVKGEEVVLIHTTYPQPDKRVLELLLLINTLKDLGAQKVRAVVPYMAYARQDSRFREGEAISINTIFKLIEGAGADEFLTVDIHKEFSLKVFRIGAKNIRAAEAIADYLKSIELVEPYILSPDRGALKIAQTIGERLGAEYGNFEKSRDRISGAITVKGEKVQAEGRDVVIADDLISTGGTIASASKIVKGEGARRVIAVCTHPLLVGDALLKMRQAGVDEVIGTDTIESEVSRITVAQLIARELSKS